MENENLASKFRVGNTTSGLDEFWTFCENVNVDVFNSKIYKLIKVKTKIIKKFLKIEKLKKNLCKTRNEK